VTPDPPVDAGATQLNLTSPDLFVGAAVNDRGADGTARGVAETALLAAPVPAAFTADTRKRYAVPFCKPITTALVPTPTPSANLVQLVLSAENSTM
jgi:hypothetical protein